jgi:hypothetical protein
MTTDVVVIKAADVSYDHVDDGTPYSRKLLNKRIARVHCKFVAILLVKNNESES